MSYVQHRAAIITFYDDSHNADSKAKKIKVAMIALFEEMEVEELPPCILGPVIGVNGYTTYFFAPDGSKEGWRDSDKADDFRKKFVEIGELHPHPNIIELSYGGDDRETRIVRTTDRKPEEC